MAKRTTNARKPEFTDEYLTPFVKGLYPTIVAYFESDEGKREFEEWKQQKAQFTEENLR